MTLRLYDTATRAVRDFESLQPGYVGMYLCGLTVQGSPHIGHVRFTVAFDILRRWLISGHGYRVDLVRNVTDIDDKILAKATAAGKPWYAWAYQHERETTAALDALGILPPTYEPRATGHIPEMIDLMRTLVERGHAYPAGTSALGDVYFDVRSWPDYGELTRQRPDDMAPAPDADPRGKRDPRDFALWKGAKSDEPPTAHWDSPYGRGRPGWHLECSAMARKYLGDTFDIHGGGVDLRFPHHENEQAQSRAAGLGFARYWLHNGWLTLGGEKMSKSLGNSLVVSQILQHTRPVILRYFLGAVHYRSTVEYHPDSLTEAAAALNRIDTFLDRFHGNFDAVAGREDHTLTTEKSAGADAVPAEDPIPPWAPGFADAMDDDLNVSGALAVIHETVRRGNTALDAGATSAAETARAQVISMTNVLGINSANPGWATPDTTLERTALSALVGTQLTTRQQAREHRDYATADAIRDRLAEAGVDIEDTPDGPRWSLTPLDAEKDHTHGR
ncbi:MAG: cysteine--tRNA ligase [Actinomycetota bacterium]